MIDGVEKGNIGDRAFTCEYLEKILLSKNFPIREAVICVEAPKEV